jgi:hypothetical protein
MFNDYAALSNRRGFNKSLAHFRLVTAILDPLGKGKNLADLVDELEKSKQLEKAQIGPILNALIVERMRYATLSFNMPADRKDFEPVWKETEKWNRFDMVVAYHHPQLGITLVNPKRQAQWEAAQDLSRQELVVLYLKAMRDEDRALETGGLEALHNLITGGPVQDTAGFYDPAMEARPAPEPAAPTAQPAAPTAQPAAPTAQPVRPAPEPARPTVAAPAPPPVAAAKPAVATPTDGGDLGKKRMTPKYSVQVTNELFHNGNVEAWKNIVESYKSKFPNLEVHIFHDGEKVNDINSLFKWGKVKNGDVLLFSVSGEDIKGVAKLQRYLFEGASIRFPAFLKKDVNKVLHLF